MEMKRMIFGLLLPAALFLAAGTGCSAKVKEYRAEAVAEYLHDTGAYTQGLFFSGGRLYESTGQFGESSLRIVDLESGRVERQLDFNSKYFVEGSVILGDKLYVLTWTNRVAYVYDAATLEYVGAYSYPRDGWGLTTDGKSLIASDGSSRLYFLTPEFQLERSVNVKMDGRPLRNLNELEWIDGRIWANVYLTDMIVVINPRRHCRGFGRLHRPAAPQSAHPRHRRAQRYSPRPSHRQDLPHRQILAPPLRSEAGGEALKRLNFYVPCICLSDILANQPPVLLSSSGEPHSDTCPFSMTTTLSVLAIVRMR